PILWTLNNVTFTDGGTASGSFVFNPDSGTACSGGGSPCGTFSNVNIVTTSGSSLTGTTYQFVCGQVATCTGVIPDSTEALFLTSKAANQTVNRAFAFFFTGIGSVPPAGLTDAGGTINISNSSGAVGAVQEAFCANAACPSPAGASRASLSGTASAVPEP